VVVLIYALTSVIGCLLLKAPFASVESLDWSSALFTSVSAVTVTGLSVIDTSHELSIWGQAIVLILIQLGGLGLIAFAVLILSALGMRIGIDEQRLLRQEVGIKSIKGLTGLIFRIARVVIVFELVGTLVLLFVFVPEFGWITGSWHALFHSVSAFNNAGFSLFPDNLSGYAHSHLLLFVLSIQIIIGGIGFIVISDILCKAFWREFRLHTRLMLVGTVCIILISFFGLSMLEWDNEKTLAQYDSLDTKLWVAWFESITPRTAGFNVIEYGDINDATALFVMLLMLIGGGSASTAGGLKVTTALVLLLATISFCRTHSKLHVFSFSIGQDLIMKVMALLTITILLSLVAVFVLLVSHELPFLDIVFEVVSALGTVGLSRGVTSELNELGRCVIEFVMLVGRIGPLSLGFLLATKSIPRVRYPEGEVYLG
jgi:trk system potassium uptake protein TrkH